MRFASARRRSSLTWLGCAALVAVAATFGPWATATPRALSADSVPALPAPSGTIVTVSTEPQLQAAVASLTSNSTIVIAPGTYTLTSTLTISGSLTNVTVRGATNSRDDVVLVGQGMGVTSAAVPHGISVAGDVTGLTIANLTIRDIYRHAILFDVGSQAPRVYNVRLINAGQHLLESVPNGAGGVNAGVVEFSVFEFATTAPGGGMSAVEVLTGQNWIIRHNLFRRIRGPVGFLAGPAVLMWNASSGTVVEGNTFIDCQREISLGLIDRTPNDHSGGVVRNNFIYRGLGMGGDVAVGVMDSPNTVVANNTIYLNGQYSSAIEYRFADTAATTIVNNLADRPATARDGATGTVQNNVWTALASWFASPATGDLHLTLSATAAIDKGLTTGSALTDWDNQVRPLAAAYDIGADEFTATGPPPDAIAPTVSMTGPAAGAVLSGTVAVSASASDNVGVTSVQFTIDGINLGVADTLAPFAISWNTIAVTDGSHLLRAVARDAAGNTTTSSAVAVTVNNTADSTPPTVTLTSPAPSATVSGAVTVSATAADNVAVAGVQFTLDGLNLGAEDLAAPFSVSWPSATVVNGAHVLRAVARDAAGNVTMSTVVTVTVSNTNDTTPPVVSVTSPTAGATVAGTIQIAATASDNVGVVGVQFTVDGSNVGTEDVTAPFAVTWATTSIANGAHVVRAIARDAAGNVTTTSGVSITVNNVTADTVLPTVSLLAPAPGATLVGAVAVTATASDNVAVVGVQFTLDGFNLGTEVTAAPYSVTWSTTSATNGVHTLRAVARDAAGNSRTSTALTVTVANPVADTTAPSVTLLTPVSGATARGVVALTAAASDDVAVSGVQFAVDGVPVGTEDTTSPYLVAWPTTLGTNGPHTVTATARDAAGNTTAVAVSVTVSNGGPQYAPGDINADGAIDLLFEHVSGQTYAWFMSGASQIGGGSPTPAFADPVWRVVALDDFTADGRSDLLWQNSTNGQLIIWVMNGLTKLGELHPLDAPTPWRISASGDFNGDGQTDIVWRLPSTGQIYVWLLDSTGIKIGEGFVVPSVVDMSWRIAATADMNLDGKTDLVWQNSTTGALYVWYMNGLAAVETASISPSSVALAWVLVAVADFDLDGKPDLVFQNGATGQLYVWYMNGLALRTGSFLTPQQVGLVWQVVGGR